MFLWLLFWFFVLIWVLYIFCVLILFQIYSKKLFFYILLSTFSPRWFLSLVVQKLYSFMKSSFQIRPSSWANGVPFRKVSSTPISCRILPMFSSICYLVLGFMFQSLFYLELFFVKVLDNDFNIFSYLRMHRSLRV